MYRHSFGLLLVVAGIFLAGCSEPVSNQQSQQQIPPMPFGQFEKYPIADADFEFKVDFPGKPEVNDFVKDGMKGRQYLLKSSDKPDYYQVGAFRLNPENPKKFIDVLKEYNEELSKVTGKKSHFSIRTDDAKVLQYATYNIGGSSSNSVNENIQIFMSNRFLYVVIATVVKETQQRNHFLNSFSIDQIGNPNTNSNKKNPFPPPPGR